MGTKSGKFGLPADALEQDARSSGTHLIERLANGGKARIVKCSALDVVEANDGHIGREPGVRGS